MLRVGSVTPLRVITDPETEETVPSNGMLFGKGIATRFDLLAVSAVWIIPLVGLTGS